MEEIRLNKYISEAGVCSRREADRLIEAGRVLVDGVRATQGMKVREGQKVQVGDRVIGGKDEKVVLAVYKPVGIVCTEDKRTKNNIVRFLKYPVRVTYAGRLDKDSEGLILLTNDGEFGFRMTHPKFAKHKLYEVELDRALEPLHQQMIGDFGMELKDGRSQLGLTKLEDGRRRWQVEMSEGRNRQIRRTFGALGYTVTRLKRLEFGPYRLSGLQPGEWCELTLE